ncbi:putative FAD dependent oxidoreductase [Aspergillus taichungensis]|uniref:Putative FAD dependent oxidoreductase n=1 Tax=Aspergillus taichungensis TaxID=482145 RepID=A0A2J5HDK1_9EURO|nr:putative FAD dependent oxidoreductase [Aspergillus taichungensis]
MTSGPTWRTAVGLAAAFLAPLTAAVDASGICAKLEAQNINVEKPLAPAYIKESNKYWSGACADLKPTCIANPSSAHEMAEIIKQLHDVDTLFAVKSGGHMPNDGFASIQDGLLITTRKLNQVHYNEKDETAVIGPGLAWEDAQEALDKIVGGRTIVGGRLGDVGVGGYMLGGGLSFLSSQYGWAANNVVSMEVVLANGTIVNANKDQNADLFMALKGGGSNFGIVTHYKLKTHPIGKVWGGNYLFNEDQTPEVLEAVRDFTENYPDDKAAIIVTIEKAAILHTWIMFLFYDGPEPPQGVFDKFKAIGPTDQTKTWDSYYDLLKHNDIFILRGQRYSIATETTPLPSKDHPEVFQTYYDHWLNVTTDVIDVPSVIGSLAFQPLPPAITKKAKALGGDMYDFDDDVPYIIIELDYSWGVSASDGRIDAALKTLYSGMDHHITKFQEQKALPDVYRPIFMNDAHSSQDFWGRIKSRDQGLATSKKYDPERFFQKRTSGGFRLD